MVLILAVYVLAVARVTRLINGDKILDRLRLYPAGKLREATLARQEAEQLGQTTRAAMLARTQERWDKALYFVGCPWCVGMWLALGTSWVPLFFAHNPVARYLGVALAASHIIGVCARFADTEDIEIEDAPLPDDDDE